MQRRNHTTRWFSLALAGLVVALSGCPTNQDPPSGDGTDGEETDGEACDPMGADAEMGMLLNAPVAEDVEIIVKTPQHPGPAGPNGLP